MQSHESLALPLQGLVLRNAAVRQRLLNLIQSEELSASMLRYCVYAVGTLPNKTYRMNALMKLCT
jgi:hypothetical protein